jgi:hypothetical protein
MSNFKIKLIIIDLEGEINIKIVSGIRMHLTSYITRYDVTQTTPIC